MKNSYKGVLMKNKLITILLLFSFNSAYSQIVIESTSGITLSPFATATRLMESATVTTLGALNFTFSSIQSRGVAGKEQLKDELVDLNDDMMSGEVKTIDQVRQAGLKELFLEISSDPLKMKEIHSVVKSGSELHKIATAVTLSLLTE
jgi:hypothetical protein